MFAGDHGTSARCSSRFVGIIFSLFNDRMAHNQSLTRTCMHVCIICSTRIRYGWMDTIHGCGLDAMGMVCMHGRSWHPVCMHVCHRHALLVCAPSTSQLLVAGARPSARCAAGCPLPGPVSSRCLFSTVGPLRCSLPVTVCLTVARAPMIAHRSSSLPVAQYIGILLVLACCERGCSWLDIN